MLSTVLKSVGFKIEMLFIDPSKPLICQIKSVPVFIFNINLLKEEQIHTTEMKQPMLCSPSGAVFIYQSLPIDFNL
jgi:hypothetical protein